MLLDTGSLHVFFVSECVLFLDNNYVYQDQTSRDRILTARTSKDEQSSTFSEGVLSFVGTTI